MYTNTTHPNSPDYIYDIEAALEDDARLSWDGEDFIRKYTEVIEKLQSSNLTLECYDELKEEIKQEAKYFLDNKDWIKEEGNYDYFLKGYKKLLGELDALGGLCMPSA